MKRVFVISFYTSILLFDSCINSKSLENEKNIQRVKLSMNIKEVIAIMGTPDTVINFSLQPNTFSLLYNPPIGNSDNFYVTFSKKDSLVLGIIKD